MLANSVEEEKTNKKKQTIRDIERRLRNKSLYINGFLHLDFVDMLAKKDE